MKQVFLLVVFSILTFYTKAQKLSAEQYIALYAPTAVYEMERSGIPASITLAQGLLESGNGNSPLAATANNHFGIKCHAEWTGDRYYQDDDEKNECFRYYTSANQSYQDHTDFLMTRSRYAFLFELQKTDYKSWAQGLKQAGYATNPQYPSLLIDLIGKYSLHQYDLKTVADFPSDKIATIKREENIVKEEAKTPVIENKTPVITNTNPTNKNNLFKEEIVVPVEEYFGDVYLVNNIKALKAKKEDTPLGIANKYNVPLNYLYKYNDMYEGENFAVGKYIYLQPKRNKGYAKFHKVQAGESMYDISQAYGIRLKDLYEKNLMESGEEAAVGEVIYLRDLNTKKPASRNYEQVLKEKNTTVIVPIEKTTTSTLSAKSIDDKIQAKTTLTNSDNSIKNTDTIVNTLSNNSYIEKTVEQTPVITTETKTVIEKVVPAPVETTKINGIEGTIISKTPIKTHEVKTGDTLYNISKRYGVSVEDIVKWNTIVNNSIKLGQILKISEDL